MMDLNYRMLQMARFINKARGNLYEVDKRRYFSKSTENLKYTARNRHGKTENWNSVQCVSESHYG